MTEKLSPPHNIFEAINSYAVETWPASDLKTDEKHPRKVTKKQPEKASSFIRAASWLPPIIIDRQGYVLAGQEWLEGARLLGMETVQVIVVDTLTEAQMRAFRIAYVRIMEDGEWDRDNLAAEFKYLIEAELSCDLDFSVEVTGFETAEIDLILDSDPADAAPDPADAVPEPEKIAISKPGDKWILGNHNIICGDSLDPAVYGALLEGTSVQLVCSDPPYNVPIAGFVSGNGAVRHGDFAMASGEMSSSEFVEFLCRFLSNSMTGLDNGGCVYVCIDWRHVEELLAAARKCSLTLLNMCVWDKGVGMMGSFYRSRHEFVLVFRKGDTSHRNNIQLGKYGRNRTNVWSYPSANMSKEGRRALKDHPTPKPVAMIADIIRDVTKVNDAVLDPFLGGGASIIGAEKTRRRCYGIELDPCYVDVTIRRWQEFTGRQAVHAQTGKTFADHGGRDE